MNKHIIYIPLLGQENIFSQQLASAFARHHIDRDPQTTNTILVQYGSQLKPLELVTPVDTLQIIFTPINNITSPLHGQTTPYELLEKVPELVNHLLQDGFDPNGKTIQLYTIEHHDQNLEIMREIARKLISDTDITNLILEWHVIPKLTQLSPEEINKIFLPSLTYRATIYSIVNNGYIKLAENRDIYIRSNLTH